MSKDHMWTGYTAMESQTQSTLIPKPFFGQTQRRSERWKEHPTPAPSHQLLPPPPLTIIHPQPPTMEPSFPNPYFVQGPPPSPTSQHLTSQRSPWLQIWQRSGTRGDRSWTWGGCPLPLSEGEVRCGVWNMRRFVRNGHFRIWEVIIVFDLDLLCVCETFLRGNDGINIPGYRWFETIRLNTAVRGSEGVRTTLTSTV